MSAATFPIARLWRSHRATRREPTATAAPRTVLIAARRTPDAGQGRIERIDQRSGRIEILLRLEDGSSGAATLLDDDVNSLELEPGDSVFVLAERASV